MSWIAVSSDALKVLVSPSVSKAGVVKLVHEPHCDSTSPSKSRYSVAAAPGRLLSTGATGDSTVRSSRHSRTGRKGWPGRATRLRAGCELRREDNWNIKPPESKAARRSCPEGRRPFGAHNGTARTT